MQGLPGGIRQRMFFQPGAGLYRAASPQSGFPIFRYRAMTFAVPCRAPRTARDAGYSLILRAVRLRTEPAFLCKNAQVNRNAFPFLGKQGHFFFPQASHCFHVRRGVRRADFIHFPA